MKKDKPKELTIEEQVAIIQRVLCGNKDYPKVIKKVPKSPFIYESTSDKRDRRKED